jgi:hypothetical protein
LVFSTSSSNSSAGTIFISSGDSYAPPNNGIVIVAGSSIDPARRGGSGIEISSGSGSVGGAISVLSGVGASTNVRYSFPHSYKVQLW